MCLCLNEPAPISLTTISARMAVAYVLMLDIPAGRISGESVSKEIAVVSRFSPTSTLFAPLS